MADDNSICAAIPLEESAAWTSRILRGPIFAVAAAAAVSSIVYHWSRSLQNRLCRCRTRTIEFLEGWLEVLRLS
jgi:uncharacterized membrane protein YoaK (UPF0700 family)